MWEEVVMARHLRRMAQRALVDSCVLQGLMWKRGRIRKTWKFRRLVLSGYSLRWFVLDELEGGVSSLQQSEDRLREQAEKEGMSGRDLEQHVRSRLNMLVGSLPCHQRGQLTVVPGRSSVLIPTHEPAFPTVYPFVLITPNRTLPICVRSSSERRTWVKTLKQLSQGPNSGVLRRSEIIDRLKLERTRHHTGMKDVFQLASSKGKK
eukprot:gnl/Dysnectes_brevis/8332_a14715_239.p1 GENE.gnl/Dysnectes_brevis/8332_a14715_239~~gnl/Dysnectes_brevis/8332_a14715_239.p1  ORF type:complete len:206 (+),score=50.42 gnl/Dysnectes_brevis/8332_a14715_239:365-982(+)